MITIMMNPPLKLNGRITADVNLDVDDVVRKKVVCALSSSNYWSSTEYNANNAWNVNFSNGNVNNNNKNNSNVIRAVAAFSEEEKEGWIEAFADCIAYKLSSTECTKYRMMMEDDLWLLMLEVHNRTYKPTVSTCFVVTRPRLREIFAANFRDRIAQHWIIIRINPILEERFVAQGDVSFNCRKNYGTLKAIQRLEQIIEQVSDGYTREAWIGKFDIKSFFMSIDKEILLSLLIPYIREHYKGNDIEQLIWLTEVVIRHCPQKLCEKRSAPVMWERLPKHKSLFYSDDNTGLAIGNITSQILANFYLSFFDEFVMTECKKVGAGYVRFVDDFAIVSTDKQFIIDMHRRASEWLNEHLKLTLHADKFYLQDVKKGVRFVGGVIKPKRQYIANETLGRMHRLLEKMEWLCRCIYEDGLNVSTAKTLEHYVCGLNSYMGFLCHNNSYGIRRKMFGRLFYFWKVCYIGTHFLVVKIKRKYKYGEYLIRKEDYELDLRKRNARTDYKICSARSARVHSKCVC